MRHGLGRQKFVPRVDAVAFDEVGFREFLEVPEGRGGAHKPGFDRGPVKLGNLAFGNELGEHWLVHDVGSLVAVANKIAGEPVGERHRIKLARLFVVLVRPWVLECYTLFFNGGLLKDTGVKH